MTLQHTAYLLLRAHASFNLLHPDLQAGMLVQESFKMCRHLVRFAQTKVRHFVDKAVVERVVLRICQGSDYGQELIRSCVGADAVAKGFGEMGDVHIIETVNSRGTTDLEILVIVFSLGRSVREYTRPW